MCFFNFGITSLSMSFICLRSVCCSCLQRSLLDDVVNDVQAAAVKKERDLQKKLLKKEKKTFRTIMKVSCACFFFQDKPCEPVPENNHSPFQDFFVLAGTLASHCMIASWLIAATQMIARELNILQQHFMPDFLPATVLSIYWDWTTVCWIAHSGAWLAD